MKKRSFIISLFVLFSSTFYSCEKEFFDINNDPNAPTQVSEALMLTGIEATFAFEVLGGDPVRNVVLWTKHLASATAAPHEGNYDIDENDVNNFWTYSAYTDVMNTSQVLIKQANENGNPGYSAIAKIIIAWNMSYLTDLFGDVPFSQASKGTEGIFKPAYDKQEDIYNRLQTLLDEAIAEAGMSNVSKPGADDVIFNGEMSKWIRLAYSLKARFHLRLTNAPGYNASAQAEKALQALAAGAIETNNFVPDDIDKDPNDNVPRFKYLLAAGSENPWYQYAIDGKWSTADRPSEFYIAMLESMNDPRIAFQATKATSGPNSGKYVGVTNISALPAPVTSASQIAPFYSAADAPLYLYIPAETHFIRAEAEYLKAGKNITPAVTDAYNKGIEVSMDMYGLSGTDVTNYQAAHALTAGNAYRQIITQKYIANYLQLEPYNDFRRTGFPELPLNEGAILDIIPLRLPVPSSERQYNAENIPAGLPIGLPNLRVPVWWDAQ